MRVLFVTEFVPWPLDTGGRIRAFHMLRQIARRHEVTVATHGSSEEAHSLAQMTGAKVLVVPHPKGGRARRLFGALTSLPSKRPYVVVGAHDDRRLSAAIHELVMGRAFDLVHLDHLDAAVYTSALNGLPTLLDEHNFETRLLQRTAERARNPLLKLYLSSQARRLASFEAAACRSANVVTAVSEEDARALTVAAPDTRICIVPNGVDRDWFRPTEHHPRSGFLVFVGSMDWLPNLDGIEWFVEEVLPLLPETHLTVVGRNPPAKLMRTAERTKRLTLTGSVTDVRPFVANAQVFVVPLRIAGGTRLKILEAFSMGVPVVSTPIGAEGLSVRDGEELLLGEDAKTFAAQILRLLDNPELRARLVKKGEAVAERHSWNAVGESMEDAYTCSQRLCECSVKSE